MSAGVNHSRVSLQPAYILHSRDFRESSAILDVLTPRHGRVSLLAKGIKRPGSARKALLQPFRSLLLSWFQGRGELYTLTSAEESGYPISLRGEYLACGYYITELTQRLTHQGEANTELFVLYDETVRQLEKQASPEHLLRIFEVRFLQLLGLLPDLANCVNGYEPVKADQVYHYLHESGAVPAELTSASSIERVSGKTLIALQKGEFNDDATLAEAKGLMRRILKDHIGDKPLYSRLLFNAYANS